MRHSKAIFGTVSMLAKIRPMGAKTDHLLIGTIRFQYFTVFWDPESQQLETSQQFSDGSEKHMRESQSRDLCMVDPTGRYLVLELFEGVLNLIKILKPRKGRGDYLDKAEQIRITELKVRASTFLYTETKQPKIAFLYEEEEGKCLRLSTYRLVDDKMQSASFDPRKDRENDIGELCPGASHLIPVPKGEGSQKRYIVRNERVVKAQLGGVIVVGETKMTYLDDESKAVVEFAMEEAAIFVAWERYDDLRYLLADLYHNLHMLTIRVDGADVMGIDVRKLGQVTKANVMVNMGEGVFYIGSHECDSMIVRIDPESEAMEPVQYMDNVAPILDFAVMDMGNREGGGTQANEYSSGQARLVTASGAFEGGSLRSVRSGVGLGDVGVLADLEDIREVFALQSNEECPSDDALIVSLPTETRIFTFDPEANIEEVDSFRGLALNHHTLLAMNLSNDLILQVTDTGAALLGRGPAFVAAQWLPPEGHLITAASANEGHVLLSTNGLTLVSLDVQQGLEEVAVQTLSNNDQIACIHVPGQIPGIGIAGFWKSGSISILDLTNLEVIQSEELRRKNDASIPRAIALTQVLPEAISGPSLFVAMEDGIVLTFNVDKSDYSLSGRKSVVLGTQEARFHVLPRDDGLFNVFATCEHPSLIYGSEGRIVYSAVTAQDAVCVCSFDSQAFPESIVVATSNQLKISQIDTERRTHVSTLPMGETIRRIAYSPAERLFGIGGIKRRLFKGEEIVTCSFSLVEDVKLGGIGEPYVLGQEYGAELIECVIRADLPIKHGDFLPAERFIVGTSLIDEENESLQENDVRGRVMVFAVDSNKTPHLVGQMLLKGACRKLAVLDGQIIAALTKTVVIFDYEETTEKSAEFTKMATYRTSTCPIDLAVEKTDKGNIIAVADLMKSLSLLEYTPGSVGLPGQLTEVARHPQAFWATAVANIEENLYLETDQDGNLIVLRRNPEGVTLTDRKRLEVISEMNLGEMVNKIQTIDVEPTPNAMVNPKAFLATVCYLFLYLPKNSLLTMKIQTEGSIYLFSLIAPSAQDLLMRLQIRMAQTIITLGGLDFNTYRSFKNTERETTEPFRFVDGELIERFLDLDEEVQQEICKGLGPSVEDVRNLVEELKRH
jgi:DNA damage-binding protein 1